MGRTLRWHGAAAMLTLLVCPSADADASSPPPPHPLTPGNILDGQGFDTDGTRCSARLKSGCLTFADKSKHHKSSLVAYAWTYAINSTPGTPATGLFMKWTPENTKIATCTSGIPGKMRRTVLGWDNLFPQARARKQTST